LSPEKGKEKRKKKRQAKGLLRHTISQEPDILRESFLPKSLAWNFSAGRFPF